MMDAATNELSATMLQAELWRRSAQVSTEAVLLSYALACWGGGAVGATLVLITAGWSFLAIGGFFAGGLIAVCAVAFVIAQFRP